MPQTRVVFFRERNGTTPLVEWFDRLPPKALSKCRSRLERLEKLGHELRRPEADLLRDGIHELRVDLQGIHYRMLYFFHGNIAAVVSHGVTKERDVPLREIELAIKRKRQFTQNPAVHIYEEL